MNMLGWGDGKKVKEAKKCTWSMIWCQPKKKRNRFYEQCTKLGAINNKIYIVQFIYNLGKNAGPTHPWTDFAARGSDPSPLAVLSFAVTEKSIAVRPVFTA